MKELLNEENMSFKPDMVRFGHLQPGLNAWSASPLKEAGVAQVLRRGVLDRGRVVVGTCGSPTPHEALGSVVGNCELQKQQLQRLTDEEIYFRILHFPFKISHPDRAGRATDLVLRAEEQGSLRTARKARTGVRT